MADTCRVTIGAVNPEVDLRLFLIRHGQTESNATGRFQGHLQIPLRPAGRQQAILLRDRLQVLEKTSPFDQVVSSDLVRASETAHIVFGPARVTEAEALRERGLGVIEGLTRAQVLADHPRFAADWAEDPSTVQSEGLEPFDAFLGRLRGALKGLEGLAEETRVAWVTHGFAIRALLHVITGIPLSKLWQFTITNTSLTEVALYQGRPRVLRLNDSSHLEGDAKAAE